jgi:hypothetical protein
MDGGRMVERWIKTPEGTLIIHGKMERVYNFGSYLWHKCGKKLAKNVAHIFSASFSFSFLLYTFAVKNLFLCVGMQFGGLATRG